ncbi:hypothetical protein SAMN02745866_03184 [Alteromonadaceae bacterium Bs31]|nr:hypothetical protein SAMN02745866_03184 [Alteromonadaceae bacterium Bs31]
MEYSKKKLTLFWVAGGFISSVFGVIPAVIYWSYVNPDWNLDVVGEVTASSLMLPVGWLFCAIIPMSLPSSLVAWVSIGAFIFACKQNKVAPLYLAYIACLVFGLFWPKAFWTMMSV